MQCQQSQGSSMYLAKNSKNPKKSGYCMPTQDTWDGVHAPLHLPYSSGADNKTQFLHGVYQWGWGYSKCLYFPSTSLSMWIQSQPWTWGGRKTHWTPTRQKKLWQYTDYWVYNIVSFGKIHFMTLELLLIRFKSNYWKFTCVLTNSTEWVPRTSGNELKYGMLF